MRVCFNLILKKQQTWISRKNIFSEMWVFSSQECSVIKHAIGLTNMLIFYIHAQHNHICCSMMGEASLKMLPH